MHVLASLIVTQALFQVVQTPILEFPEPELDDPAAYEGYSTRFFRDSHRNPFQVYLDTRSGRVVHVWADASNASAAFTVRGPSGEPAPLAWGGPGAAPHFDGRRRAMRHRLESPLDALEIGWFVLGTMRQERDFQYWQWHKRPYGDEAFSLKELTDLIDDLERVRPAERQRHLALLNATDVAELRSRVHPHVSMTREALGWIASVQQRTLDGRNEMTLELRGDTRETTASVTNGVLSIRARSGGGIQFDITVTTDAPVLTPLDRAEIFNSAFDAFYQRQKRIADSVRTLSSSPPTLDSRVASFRRLEREIRGLELLSFEEKLMASMPNYATYFGRDMMMAALMLEPISSVDLQEHVIASVLGKVAPSGDVSHEEALGGQAIRENAAEYSAHIRAWEEARESDEAAAREHLAAARDLLANLQAVRENYHMIDDDFQLAVLVDRYLARVDAPASRKRRFLSETGANGLPRVDALMRNLALVAALSRPYVEEPTATNLVGFLHRDDKGWLPGSWRDSRVGYGNGRFAMDVNAVWVPKALEATQRILQKLEELDLPTRSAVSRVPANPAALVRYLDDPATLQSAITTWRGARRHFEVRFTPDVIREHVAKALEAMGERGRSYWRTRFEQDGAAQTPLWVLAVALDNEGRPIPATNTDPATDLFLEDYTDLILNGTVETATVLRMVDVIGRPYPVGLLVDGLGPLVVNDVYASATVQQQFRDDLYHSPRVVWGREVNLLFLGLGRQIAAAYDASGRLRDDSEAPRTYVRTLWDLLEATLEAVEASGLRHNELWSYRIDNGVLRPVRYGTSSDIQLWNVTDLAVRFVLDQLPAPPPP